VAHVTAPDSGKLFRYYNDEDVELGNVPQLAAIKRIRISFSIGTKHPNPNIGGNLTSTLATSIELRN
jgi:hypothetical protein